MSDQKLTYCPTCGKPNQQSFNFCVSCGKPLNAIGRKMAEGGRIEATQDEGVLEDTKHGIPVIDKLEADIILPNARVKAEEVIGSGALGVKRKKPPRVSKKRFFEDLKKEFETRSEFEGDEFEKEDTNE